MLPLGIETLATALGDLRSVIEFEENARLHFSEEADLSKEARAKEALKYIEAKRTYPRTPTFQVYAHCASITRLYAVYESYVYELVKSWLAELCLLSKSWSDLPEMLCTNYRVGVGILLQKFPGPRTAHLTELTIVQSLHTGLTGASGFDLLPDAFFIDLQNLREAELAKLFSRIGLEKTAAWLKAHPRLTKHCEQYGYTSESRLKELITFRNDAAHGDVDEVLGISEFLTFIEFVEMLCRALSELVRHSLIERAEAQGKYQIVGRVTEFFPRPQASIARMQPVRIHQGDSVVVRRATECFVASVTSIQADGNDVDVVDAVVEQELGICFAPVAPLGSELLMPVPP